MSAKCMCDRLPADFEAGFDHHRMCPAGHGYQPKGGVSLTGIACRKCGRGPRDHATTPTREDTDRD